MNGNEKSPKIPKEFVCILCDVTCIHKGDWNKHVNTIKHKNLQNGNNDNEKSPKIPKIFACDCGKEYNYISGLSRHKKKCNFLKEENLEEQELVKYLMKENSELKNMILDVCKNMQPSTNISNSNNNSHNKTFNLQVFLNETCKDAMNIMDFIDSIKIQLEDLEDVGKLGYINGISNIIMKNLKALDISQRPVHCSDSKRETLYVKDQDKWEKEDETNSKLRKAIRRIAYKNTKVIRDWRDIHPDHDNSFSKTSDIYQQIVIESMGGKYYETTDTEAKIIKNIAKHVVIDK